MVVYADAVFIINFIAAYIMLYILGFFINKSAPNWKQLSIASAVGALGATVVFCTEMPLLLTYAIRLLTVIIMLLIVFFKNYRNVLKQLAWFILLGGIVSFVMVFIVSLASKPLGIITKAGVLYLDLPMGIFLLLLAISYIAMIFFAAMFKNRKNKKYYTMTVTHNDKTITVTALFDSGNLLKEPITGKYVNILEWESVKELFGLDCGFSEIGEHAEEMKLWAIPFKSLGNQNGILFAFLADKVEIPEEKKCHINTFIGIYGIPLSKNNEYHALINAGLL